MLGDTSSIKEPHDPQPASAHMRNMRTWRSASAWPPTPTPTCSLLLAAQRPHRRRPRTRKDHARTSELMLFKDAFEARLLAFVPDADHFHEGWRTCDA
jgi:hypothetical protein